MKKVENIGGYKFDSCTYFRVKEDKTSAKLENMIQEEHEVHTNVIGFQVDNNEEDYYEEEE